MCIWRAHPHMQQEGTFACVLRALRRWVAAASADALGAGPCERMCHSMTGLRDGRLLLLGGRHKEGICRDMWWLDAVRAAGVGGGVGGFMS